MSRPASDQPTDGELEILQVLWESGPTELGQICARMRERRTVATTTVATMLKVMLGKGLVKRRQGPRGAIWAARRSARITTQGLVRKLVDRVFGGSARHLVMHLISDEKLSETELAEIRRLLQDYRNEKSPKDDASR